MAKATVPDEAITTWIDVSAQLDQNGRRSAST